jgi:predicted transcriptional regulator
MADSEQPDLTTLTVQLLSAYFANNSVPSNEIAALIDTTRTALAGKTEPDLPALPEYVPAVTVRKSLSSRDQILSMIDGKPYKTLKRHLAGHGLTPAEYRSRYNLPADYPIVAPGYSEQRREVARKLGLGRRPVAQVATEATPAASQEVTAEPAPSPAPKPGGAKRVRAQIPSSQLSTPAGEDASADKVAAPRKRRAERAAKPKRETRKVASSTISAEEASGADLDAAPDASTGGSAKPAKRTAGTAGKDSGAAASGKPRRRTAAKREAKQTVAEGDTTAG